MRPTVNAHTGEQVGIWCCLHDILNVSPDDYCSRGEKKLAPVLCARCGWNPEEHARRQALPLTENADGLRHKDISQPKN